MSNNIDYARELQYLEDDAREWLEDEMKSWMRVCPDCELKYPDEYSHCTFCGAYLICPACGTELHPPVPHSCSSEAKV